MAPPQDPRPETDALLEEVLVFVDIPDVDNVLCCLSVINTFPNRLVHIILSPRPVDFQAEPYPEDRNHLNAEIGQAMPKLPLKPDGKQNHLLAGRAVITPIADPKKLPWVEKIKDEKIRKFFERKDEVFKEGGEDNEGVQNDTRIYMEASAYRFASFLHERQIPSDRYRFYWDPASMNTIAPGLRHATHVPDYTYGYTDNDYTVDAQGRRCERSDEDKVFAREQLGRHETIFREGWDPKHSTGPPEPDSDEIRRSGRRRGLRAFCRDYVEYEAKKGLRKDYVNRDVAGQDMKVITTPFDDLIDRFRGLYQAHKANLKPEQPKLGVPAMIGGPFTEALKWLEATKEGGEKGPVYPIDQFWAMAGYRQGLGNILPNQFNIAIDICAAWNFFRIVEDKRIPTLLVPTECIKAPGWSFSETQLATIFEGYDVVRNAIETFTAQSSVLKSLVPYDWVAAILARHPELLIRKSVIPYLTEPQGYEEVDGHATLREDKPYTGEPSPSLYPPVLTLKFETTDNDRSVKMCMDDSGPNNELREQFHAKVIQEMRKDLASRKD